MKCDSTTGKCDNVFPTPLEAIYYDATEPTFILYSCFDLKSAANVFMDLLNVPPFWKNLIMRFQGWLGRLHYSNMIVASQNPTTLSETAVKAVDTFISNFSDTPSGYKRDLFLEIAARAFGWDGNFKYSLNDVPKIDQSQATCNW